MLIKGRTVVGCLLLSACADEAVPQGIASARVVTMGGECGLVDPDPDATDAPALLALRELPYERARAAASYQRGPTWDGHLITMGWTDGNGGVSRLYVELSPTRGYGISQMPDLNQQAMGFVEWSGTERTFAARAVRGLISYDQALGDVMQALLAFDGVGRTGLPECRVIGLHASRTRDRFEPYDPSWLAPNPSAMITANTAPPSLAGDVAPSNDLVAPADAPPDPWPDAPVITGSATSKLFASNFAGGGFCD